MPKTETAMTQHGEVEYEVVECASCGNDVSKEDAQDFLIGDITSTGGYHSSNKYTVECATTGYACPVCADSDSDVGPIGFPTGRTNSVLRSAFKYFFKFIILPLTPVKEEAKNQGFDDADAGFFAFMITALWAAVVTAVVLFVIPLLIF